MNVSEVRKLFFLIENTYDWFPYDDAKVEMWHQDYLHNVPYEVALGNLRHHASNPENKKAPHPGALMHRPAAEDRGPYVPNVEETRRFLAERDREWAALKPANPQVLQEARAKLGYDRHAN